MCTKVFRNGFTLIELLVTIAVFAVIVGVAIPSFQNIIVSNSVSFSRDEFFSVLTYSRSEAIKSGTSVTVCRSSDSVTCDDSLDWGDGWLIFVDINQDGNLDSADRIIRSVAGLEGDVTMTHGGSDDRITFDSRGLALRGSGTITFSHFTGSEHDRTVDLGVTGRSTKGS